MLTVFFGTLTVHDPLHVDRKQNVLHHSNREFDNSMEREKLPLYYNELWHFRCRVLDVARGACFANHKVCFYIKKYAYIGHLVWKNVTQSFSKTFSIGKLKKRDRGQNSVHIPHFLQGLHNHWTRAWEELFDNFNFMLWLKAHRRQQTNQQQTNIKTLIKAMSI